MTPGARRILIPLVVVALALGVVFAGFFSGRSGSTASPPTSPTGATAGPGAGSQGTSADPATTALDGDTVADGSPDTTADALTDPPASGAPPEAYATFTTLRAIAPSTGATGHETPPTPLGSLSRENDVALIEFSRAGAGISRITFSDIWETARARRQADAHYAAIARGKTPTTALPEDMRYILQHSQILANSGRAAILLPSLAARYVIVNGVAVSIFDFNDDDNDGQPDAYVWAEVTEGDPPPPPGTFETTIVDENENPVARIRRRFTLGANYDITIEQRFFNLTDKPLTVKWIQDGPASLRIDRSRYMDRRRARFGYLEDVGRDPARKYVLADDNALLLEWTDLMKFWKKAGKTPDKTEKRSLTTLWPNKTSLDNDYELAWFGQTNRYFGLTVHPVIDANGAGERSLASRVAEISMEVSEPAGAAMPDAQKIVTTLLWGPERTVAPGAELNLDIAAYAGPLDGHILEEEPYSLLAMQKLILFQMSSFCAICTFQWLAYGLHDFLSFLHSHVLFDWGLAIIALVIMVRLLLHPLTKRSQISMQRFGKQMSAMKPELDKLQKKIGNDPKKLQQEQMKLMREHGANPLQMLGCLPMFLQTPIWIALYAMLYFTFELRQDPAFFGVFQMIGGWPFLGDLSAADHFFGELDEPVKFLMWNVTGFNALPLLMGVIFFVQQKYMSPPPSPTMTEDQLKQQKIMKVMMVVLFPLMLYSAPSGLTLYILTSSSIGILESKYVRRHISEMDLNPPQKKERKKVKPKDAQGRAFAASIERREEERRRRAKPTKNYKKRK